MKYQLQSWLSKLSETSEGKDWNALALADADRVLQNASTEEALVAHSQSHNGFVRQRALERLAAYRSEAVLVAVIDRLNDWVPAVRHAAVEVIRDFLQPAHAALLLANLERLDALRGKLRSDHTELLDAVSEVLTAMESMPAVRHAFPQARGKRARLIFDLMTQWGDAASVAYAIAEGCAHSDPMLRKKSLTLSVRYELEQAVHRVQAALSDPMPAVRTHALRLWMTLGDQERSIPVSMLVDRSPGVRALALWFAKAREMDVCGLAMERLQSPPKTSAGRIGLLGLCASLRLRQAVVLAEAALADSVPAVRCAGLLTLVTIEPALVVQATSDALLDKSPKIFRLARELVRHGTVDMSPESLLNQFDRRCAASQVPQAALIASLLPLWWRLEALLRGIQATGWRPEWEAAFQEWAQRRHLAYAVGLPDEMAARLHAITSRLIDGQPWTVLPDVKFAFREAGLGS